MAALSAVLLAPESRTLVETWTGPDGSPVRPIRPERAAVSSYLEAEHCGWQSVVFLQLGEPLADPPVAADRTYVRDPDGVLSGVALTDALAVDATLPDGSVDTGYDRGEVALWLGPDRGERYAYLVRGEVVERWPRAVHAPACA